MTIYIDHLRPYRQKAKNTHASRYFGMGKASCHMFTDGNIEELHQFAEKIGLKRSYLDKSPVFHYDLTPSKRDLAIKHGAIEMDIRNILTLISRASAK